MKIFIFWLIEVIIECGMFHLWWVKVYMCERKSNMTKRKLTKDSCAFLSYLCHQKRSDEFEEDKRRLLLYFLKGLILIVVGMGVIPLAFAFVFANEGLILQLIILICFFCVPYKVLENWSIDARFDEYIDFLKKYQKVRSGRCKESYSETDFKDTAPNDRKSILDNKIVLVIVVLVTILAALVIIYYRVCNILYVIKQPEATEILSDTTFNKKEILAFFVLGVVTLLGAISLKKEEREKSKNEVLRKKSSMNLGKEKNSIIIDTKLSQWKDDIYHMCEDLHIKSAHVYINDSVQGIAEATREKRGVSIVTISKYYFTDMNQYFDRYMFKKVIMFIIGHELVHIHFNDRSKMRTAVIRTAIVVGAMIFLFGIAMLLYVCNLMQSVFSLAWAVSGIYIMVFVASVMVDFRYWGQIKELRADRVGMEVSNTSPNVFDAFASYCQYNLSGDSDEKSNIVYFFYKQYVKVEEHPSLKRRSIELHRNKKWGITEHIRYCWMIRWKLWGHHGWKL